MITFSPTASSCSRAKAISSMVAAADAGSTSPRGGRMPPGQPPGRRRSVRIVATDFVCKAVRNARRPPYNRGMQDVRDLLVRQLRGAYSGELAAAFAYRGHWRSVSDDGERERIRTIEAEEWHHRELVGAMLRQLGAKPNAVRELIIFTIG